MSNSRERERERVNGAQQLKNRNLFNFSQKMFFVCLLVSSFGLGFGAKASDVSITTATPKTYQVALGYDTQRTIFRTTDSKLILIYSDTGHIYFRTSSDNGATWSASTSIKYVDDYTGYSFSGVMDASNNVYLTYSPTRGSSQYVFVVKMTYSSGSWSVGTERTVESSGTTAPYYPDITQDSSGKLWASYTYYDGANYAIRVKSSSDGGSTWSSSTTITQTSTLTGFSELSLYNNQYPIIVYSLRYSGDSGYTTRSQAYNGTSWGNELDLTANSISTQNFSLVKVGNNVHFIGGVLQYGSIRDYIFNGTSWSAGTVVNSSVNDSYDPQIVTDGTNVWLFYAHYNGSANSYDIFYKRYDGTSWDASGTAVTNSGANNRYPHVPGTVVQGDNIPLVYQSGTAAPFTVYGSTITPPDSVSPNVTAFTMPSTASATVVNVSSFTAADNIGVTGYLITESASTPSGSDPNWSVSAPATFTFLGGGSRTAYAWAKDGAGNISTSVSQSVTITLPTYTIRGTLSGLTGGTAVLQNNGGDNLSVSANGSFTFATGLNSGADYAVSVLTYPTGQGCTISNGSGTVASSNITSVSISCANDVTSPNITAFTMPSTASATVVNVSSFTATDNVVVAGYLITESSSAPSPSSPDWSVTVPANFTFSGTGLKTAYAWAKDGAGNISTSVSQNVTITLPTYTIGGTLSGLTSGTAVLQNNGGDNLSVSANGSFTFATGLNSGADYAVSVLTQPAGQHCTVSSAAGVVASSNVTTVSISCTAPPTLSVIPNGSDSSPNSPLHMLPGATKRVYANQCIGAQSLGCTSTSPTIAWSATCGTFSAGTGPFVDYTTPASGNSCIITATDAVDSLTATATVTMEHPTVTVNVMPHAITLYKGQHQLLQAFVVGSSNRAVNWSTTGGTLTAQGWSADFVANTQGTYTVAATSQADNSKNFSATIYVTDNAMPAVATVNHTEPIDCTATGNGTTYDVGPSQAYTTINSVPWASVGAGDTVRIHNEGGAGNPTVYHERWLINTSGTETEPLRVCGVANGSGELPVIDGADSTTLSSYNFHTMDGLGVIILYAGYGNPGDSANYVQHIIIEGLKVINAQSNPIQQYHQQNSGTLTTFPRGTAGIRVQSGANITIRGNDLENDDNGFFSNAQTPETLMSRWHLVQGNYFKNDGTVGDTHDHSIYAQAFGQIVQGNYFDDKVTGDQGSQIKTRSAANIVRYNYIQAISNTSLGRLLDIVSPEASSAEAMVQEFLPVAGSFTTQTVAGVTAMEDWYNAYVYGNIFNDTVSSVPIHYSEDNCSESVTGLPGYFYNNTFYEHGVSAYRWFFIDGDYGAGGPSGCFGAKPRTRFPQAVVVNNAIKIANTTITNPYFFWSRNVETPIYLYTNWISSAWGNGGAGEVYGNGTAYQQTYQGVSYMTGNSAQHVYIGNTGTTCSDNTCGGKLILSDTPSQLPFDGTTYKPIIDSPLIGAAVSLPAGASALPVTYQYDPSTYLLLPRANASDIGAMAFANLDISAPTITAFTIPATATSFTVPISTFTATDDTGVTGYMLTESSSAPASGDAGWSGSAPTEYVFSTEGAKTLYAWAKDAAGNVSTSLNDSVTVTLPTYTIGGTISGLTGTVVLRNNGGDDLSRSVSGSFAFATSLHESDSYTITILTQPSGQTCSVTSGSGTVSGGNISNVSVACFSNADITAPTVTAFTIPATATSLTVSISTFTATDAVGVTGYMLTESSVVPEVDDENWQETAPTEYVFATEGNKTLYAWAKDAAGNVSASLNDSVTITLPTYTIGGTISGLSGTVVLQNNTGDDLNLSAAGSFTFATAISDSDEYDVTVSTQPEGQTCVVTNGSGVVSEASITDVTVTCEDGADATTPTITSFTIPATSASLIVTVSEFTATDTNGVTGYLLTETSSAPLASDALWSATAPTSYNFSSAGSKTLYAWAKDAAGNVSASLSDSVAIIILIPNNSQNNEEEYDKLDISKVKHSVINGNQIRITFRTNNSAKGIVRFGSNKNLKQKENESRNKEKHIINLKKLVPGAKYYFRISAEDKHDQSERTKIYSVTLPKLPTYMPTATGSQATKPTPTNQNQENQNPTPQNSNQNQTDRNTDNNTDNTSNNSSSNNSPQPQNTFKWYNPFTWF